MRTAQEITERLGFLFLARVDSKATDTFNYQRIDAQIKILEWVLG